MGNGASVQIDKFSAKSVVYFKKVNSKYQYDLGAIEILCKSGYFSENFGYYCDAFQKAIAIDALDVLEILITVNDVKRLKPLHVAALEGKLDAVELLVSAGFSCSLNDDKGRTPLHICCCNPSIESGLCVTFLCVQFKKAAVAVDLNGYTPLHIAVSNRNINCIKALLENVSEAKTLLKKKCKQGQTPGDIALDFGYKDIWKLLKEREHEQTSRQRKSTEIDEKRIMQIWEKFFENAFSRLLNDDEDKSVDSDRHNYNLDYKHSQFFDNNTKYNTKNNISRAEAKSSKSSSRQYKNQIVVEFEGEDFKSHQSVDDNDSLQASLLSWFDWIVTCDHSYDDAEEGIEGYYVIHKVTKARRWLQDHINIQKQFYSHLITAREDAVIKIIMHTLY